MPTDREIEAAARALTKARTCISGPDAEQQRAKYVDENWLSWAGLARAALSAAEAADGDGWQPIETAPKTSNAILVWCPARENIYVVCWWDSLEIEPTWLHFGGSAEILGEVPTYWRPLPPPPTDAGTGLGFDG